MTKKTAEWCCFRQFDLENMNEYKGNDVLDGFDGQESREEAIRVHAEHLLDCVFDTMTIDELMSITVYCSRMKRIDPEPYVRKCLERHRFSEYDHSIALSCLDDKELALKDFNARFVSMYTAWAKEHLELSGCEPDMPISEMEDVTAAVRAKLVELVLKELDHAKKTGDTPFEHDPFAKNSR